MDLDQLILKKLKQKIGIPEILKSVQLAGYKITIQELLLRINQLEK